MRSSFTIFSSFIFCALQFSVLLFLLVRISFPCAHAEELIAEYSFEEEQPSMQVKDLVGPPFSNGLSRGAGEIHYGLLSEKQALDVDGLSVNAITLEEGAEDEFLSLLDRGLRVKLKFQVTAESWGRMTLLAMSEGPATGNRAWEICVFESAHATSLSGRVFFNLSFDGSEMVTVVTPLSVLPNVSYQVIAEWDPLTQKASLEVFGNSEYEVSSISVPGSQLFSAATPVTIGSLSNGSQPFHGLIDDIKIYRIHSEK